MVSFNRVHLVGRLTRDPELKKVQDDKSVCSLGVALNERVKNGEGEYVEKPCFIDVIVWDRQAEVVVEHLTKGSAILVEGRLQYDSWKDKTGAPRNKIRIKADRIEFLPLSAPKKQMAQ